MKDYFQVLLLAVCMIVANPSFGQESSETHTYDNHISLENFPKNMAINHIEGWGGMTISVNEATAGTDFAPLLEGLKNNSCQVPHWGYIMKGKLRLTYDDGTEEVLKEGDVFYMPPGHVAFVEEDLKLMDFSPQEEFGELVEHIDKKIAEANSGKH